jgi:hypothetical protein
VHRRRTRERAAVDPDGVQLDHHLDHGRVDDHDDRAARPLGTDS